MSFEHACTLADLPPVGGLRVEMEGAPGGVAIIRDEEGTVHAIEDQCSHGAVSLAEGEVEGSCVECWLHGSRFDLRTGEPRTPPATAAIRVYAVRLEGEDVLVDVSVTVNA